MVKLVGMLSRFSRVQVLVIGDFMLDTYTTGKVRRISPEAPVSVLHVQKEESRPGGAGNVVLNLVSLGAEVIAVGRVGADLAGTEIRRALAKEGVDISGLFTQKDYVTPVKNRLIADSQQILRVDTEAVTPVPEVFEQAVIKIIPSMLEQVQIVAISDYAKGFLSRSLLAKIIEMAKEKGIPVIVDPKGIDFSRYKGATVIKPNLTEAYAAAKLPLEVPIERVASAVLSSSDVEMLLITRSEAGMSLFDRKGNSFHFPVSLKEVKDVTGAGDTVLAMISIAMANKLDIRYGAQLANIAAGMAIERLGCARINLSELSVRLLEYDVENKIFDEEHLFALQQALNGKRYCVLGLDSTEGMNTALFRSIRRLADQEKERKLIVYVRDNDPDEEFVSLLTSLAEVDFVVLKCESLKNLCEIIQPHQVFLMENNHLALLEHPEALILGSQK
jgi:rfaE bifunctional protein kinase chain/domain